MSGPFKSWYKCGKQGRKMEGGREVMCMGCRHAVWDKKSKGSRRKERLRIE
jgi:hypothetical protein